MIERNTVKDRTIVSMTFNDEGATYPVNKVMSHIRMAMGQETADIVAKSGIGAILKPIPEEYRNGAYMDVFILPEESGVKFASLSLKYLRPETDKELNARMERSNGHTQWLQNEQDRQESRIRNEYERMKALFEGK